MEQCQDRRRLEAVLQSPLPPRVDASAEELAERFFRTQSPGPAVDFNKIYQCGACERVVTFPEVLYMDGKCEQCHTTPV